MHAGASMKSSIHCRQLAEPTERIINRDRSSRSFCYEQLIPPALAIGLYSNSLSGDFVHDDLSAITSNPDVTGHHPVGTGSWDFLHNDFWGTSLLDPTSHKSYRPLTVLTFRWNYFWSGLDPWSYHAVNVLLHALVCWLLHEWLCRRCFHLSRMTSLLTSSLFAVHPIHTEAVAGIVGRADILSTLFFLLSFICHDRGYNNFISSRQRSLLRAASLVSALCALASKENGIAALPVVIAWDIICLMTNNKDDHKTDASFNKSVPNDRWNRYKARKCSLKMWVRSCRFRASLRSYIVSPILFSIFVTLVLLAGRIALQQGQLPLFSEQDNPAAFASDFKSRILTLIYLPAFNMGLLLAPVLLSYDWQNGSIPLVEDWWDLRNAASLLLYASLLAAVLYSWLRRQKALLWSAAVMVLSMLPASNLFYPCGFVVAERLLYLPSLGYCLIVAVGIRRIARRSEPKQQFSSRRTTMKTLLLTSTILLTVSSFVLKTWTRNEDWKDRKTLFESGLRSLPNNAKMHYNYANVQKDEGRWETAIHHYRQAIQLWPDYASALNNLGTVLLAQAEETEMDDESIVINNEYNYDGSSRNKERNVFRRQDSALVKEAENRFREAIRVHPEHIHAHYNLAVIHTQRNETDLAIRFLQRCLKLNSGHREALQLFGMIQPHPKKTSPAVHRNPDEGQVDCSSRWMDNPKDPSPSRAGCPNTNSNYRWNKTA